MKHFFVIANHKKDMEGIFCNEVSSYLISRGATCSVFDRDDLWKNDTAPKDSYRKQIAEHLPDGCECIIVLGGDGTLIQAVSALAGYDIPFIGINIGTLGYLTEGDREGIPAVLDALLEDHFHVEERMMIQGDVIRDGEIIDSHHALNDIVMSRYGQLRVIHCALSVNGTFLNSYAADGLIICTATGSTAYNLSAGGPICFPSAKMLVVTPVCAHTLNSRSIILPNDVTVDMSLLEESNTDENAHIVTFDGGYSVPIRMGDIVRVTQMNMTCKLLRLHQTTFLDTLRQKLKSI